MSEAKQIPLTREEIERDIEVYQDRLSRAEVKLNDLPPKLMGKKLKQTRCALVSEIRHVRTLISYARKA